MIYSKLCSNIFKSSKDNLILSQRCTSLSNRNCLFYSNSILNKIDDKRSKLIIVDNQLNKPINQSSFLNQQQNVNSRRFLYLNNKDILTATRLPILYKDISKSFLSSQSTTNDNENDLLKFKKIHNEGNLSLVQTKTPIEMLFPKAYTPYIELLRLNKFTGTMFLLYPCLWSIGLGGEHGNLPNIYLMGQFVIGAILMRSAGCIINDLMDKKYDRQIERTKSRPLASGRLANYEAIAALAACLTGSLHILLSFDCLT